MTQGFVVAISIAGRWVVLAKVALAKHTKVTLVSNHFRGIIHRSQGTRHKAQEFATCDLRLAVCDL